jgi:hypothetical protein
MNRFLLGPSNRAISSLEGNAFLHMKIFQKQVVHDSCSWYFLRYLVKVKNNECFSNLLAKGVLTVEIVFENINKVHKDNCKGA